MEVSFQCVSLLPAAYGVDECPVRGMLVQLVLMGQTFGLGQARPTSPQCQKQYVVVVVTQIASDCPCCPGEKSELAGMSPGFGRNTGDDACDS